MRVMKRTISAIIAMLMIMTALPVMAIPSGDDVDASLSIKGYLSSMDDISDDYQGHYWRLEKVEADDDYADYADYKVTVGVRDMMAAVFHTAIAYKDSDMDLIDMNTGTKYDPVGSGGDLTGCFVYAPINEAMTVNAVQRKKTVENATLFIAPDSADSDMDLTDGYNRLHKAVCVEPNLGATAIGIWSDNVTGSYNPDDGYTGSYTTPTDVNIDLFSIYFKMTGKTAPDADSFKAFYHMPNEFSGGVGVISATEGTHLPVLRNEGVCLVGFEKPATPDVNINFTVTNKAGAVLPYAKVTLYKEASHTTQVGEATTDTNGEATISAPGSETYYYTVTMTGYQTASGVAEVGTSAKEVPSITLIADSEVEYSLDVTVQNADNNQTVGGATVSAGSATGTTDSAGKATLALTNGPYSVTASKTGFTDGTESVTISGANSTVAVKITPNRAKLTLPSITDGSTSISGAKYSIKKTSTNQTTEWGDEKTFNSSSEAALPADSTFEMTTIVTGYSTKTYYIKTVGTTAEIYTDSAYQTPYSGTDITVEKMDDPYYEVTGTDIGSNQYQVEVTLNNIDAVNGTFGLRYDKNVFTLSSFLLNTTELQPGRSDDILTDVTQSDAGNNIGYHAFTWEAKTASGGAQSFDTNGAGKTVATYTFDFNTGKTANDITSSAFTVMPYDKTAAAQAYAAKYGINDETNAVLSEYWRYCDDQNEGTLGEGRINKDKSLYNGFFQVFANESVSVTTPSKTMHDVITQFDFAAALPALEFEVVDYNGMPLSGVDIALTSDGNTNTITTDSTGIAETAVDVSKGSVTYSYSATHDGYWTPVTGTVTIPQTPIKTEHIKLTLEEKVYHDVVLVDENDAPVTDASVSGGYAYTNRDYGFNIVAGIGSKFKGASSLVAVIEGVDVPVSFSSKDNMFIIDKTQVVGDKKPNVTADLNGFEGNEIKIKLPANSIEPSDDKYIARAIAGTHGSVSYVTGSAGTVDGTTPIITVKDLNSGDDTGEFTFTADPNYVVERVLINGAEITAFDGLQSFNYKFEEVSRDNTIIVTFWDGNTPSTDSVVTLVVGDRGSASVKTPAIDTSLDPIRNGARSYLYTSDDTFTFEAEADTGYVIKSVERSIDGGSKTSISGSTSYSAAIQNGHDTVIYVSFAVDGYDSFTVFVKSYVKSGKGFIDEAGILPYNKNDKPTFEMTPADKDWKLNGVDVDGNTTMYQNQLDSGTYTADALTADSKIGAIFNKTAYKVTGLIDFSNQKTLTAAPVKAPAILTFVSNDNDVVIVYSTNGRNNATFEANLSKGTWTLTVKKKGFLDYIITDFPVAEGQSEIKFGAATAGGDAKAIIPIIGDTTGDGAVVSLSDAGVIGSALRTGAGANLRDWADVDDDSSTGIEDMSYVKDNYGKRRITETYSVFCNS